MRSFAHVRFFLNTCLLLAFCMPASGAARSDAEALSLRGTIRDQGQGTVSGVTVQLFSEELILETRTNEQGDFTFSRVPAGDYRLEAYRAGFDVLAIPKISITDQQPSPLALTLKIAPTSNCGGQERPSFLKATGDVQIAGKVQGWSAGPNLAEPGSALAADIFVTRENQTEILQKARANEKGEFQFKGLAPGRYVLRAWHAGYYDLRAEPFQVTRANITFLRLLMHREGMILLCQ